MSESTEFKVGYVAGLARLDITAEEAERFQPQLDGILSYIEALRDINVDGIEPTAHPAPVLDRLREDSTPASSISQESFLRNAPDTAKSQLRVPKVIDLS